MRNPNTLYLVFKIRSSFKFHSFLSYFSLRTRTTNIVIHSSIDQPILYPRPLAGTNDLRIQTLSENWIEIMKFWKILSNQIEQTLPDWRDKFLSYKDLKKQLKLIAPKDAENPPGKKPRLDPSGDGDGEVTKEVKDFLKLLEVEIDKFNGFFVEKEEEYIIKWKVTIIYL